MQPKNLAYGGGSTETVLHPLVAIALALGIILILLLRRKHISTPLLAAVLLIPMGQVVLIGGAHFTAAKILFLTGAIRWVMSRGSLTLSRGWNSVDRVFALWACCYPLVVTLQWMESQAFIKVTGDWIENFFGYFVLRYVIQDAEDVRRVVRGLVVITAVMAACMLAEPFTGQNVFGLLGGVRRFSEVRDGVIRANGAFQHSILAGSFGATMLPLFVSLWTNQRFKIGAVVGVIAATSIVAVSHGSTPALAYVAGIFALCLWPLRRQMRLFRWGVVLTLVGLHLVMNGPVWSLIQKIDLTGSSSSYHRYMLIDNCIKHFGEWWLIGTKDFGNWGYNMWDMSNQYVAYAVTGGLVTIVSFIAIIARSFGAVGIGRKRAKGDHQTEWHFWCLGAALFAHTVSYFGIGYFDQMKFAWFLLLALIGASTSVPEQRNQRNQRSTETESSDYPAYAPQQFARSL